jgi:Kelch motif
MRKTLTTLLAAMLLVTAACGETAPSPASTPTATPGATTTVTAAPLSSPSATPALPSVAGTWTRLDDMSVARWSLEAIELLDGRVFVIDQARCGGASELHGPPDPPGPTELLDPKTGTWSPAAALNAFRSGFVAARLPDDRVLVTGGDNGWDRSYSSTKLFDPTTGHWANAALLGTARIHPIVAGLPDGRILVAGGTYSEGFAGWEDFSSWTTWPEERPLTSAEIFDPVTSRWATTGSLHDVASAGDAYVLPDGRVVAVASPGRADPGPVEIFDPSTERWSTAGLLARPSGSATTVLADGTLVIVGGMVSGELDRPLPDAWRFDPWTGRSWAVAPMPVGRHGAVAVLLADGRVLVAGGTTGETRFPEIAPPTATTVVYDPAADAWSAAPPMPFAANPAAGLRLADGGVLVVGGSRLWRCPCTDGCGPDPVGWTARFVLSP